MNGKNKKAIAGAVALSMALSGVVYATSDISKASGSICAVGADAAAFVNGDVNQDGKVTLDDAQLALKGALKIKTDFTELQLYAADVDSSDVLDLTDAQLILKHALKIENLPAKAAPVTPDVSEEPEVTSQPGVSVEPVISEKPSTAPSRKPAPSEEPVVPMTPTPVPTAATIPAVAPADYVVSGEAARLVATNGAIEANGVYTFTDANKEASLGLEFQWPYSGRKDMRQTLEEAGVTLDAIKAIPKTYLQQNALQNILDTTGTIDYEYPRPKWSNGVSISFWSKQKWEMDNMSNAGPLLIIARTEYCDRCQREGIDPGYGGAVKHHTQREDCDFGFVLFANGTVTFLAGDEAKNGFRAGNLISDKDNEWTHYTVTFANDFITVYVNGQEMVYQSINLDKDDFVECFNAGFMTRYNPAGLVTQDMLDKDIRKYLTINGLASTKRPACEYNAVEKKIVTNWEATLIGNSCYEGDSAGNNYMLLMDLFTQDNVRMYLGGREPESICCINYGRTGFADYNTPSGSQVAGLMCYESELKPAEVAAIYEDSKNTYKDVLELE